MCLLIGPSGVGKTLFLKRLQNCNNSGGKYCFENVGEAPSTIPTVGTNLVNIGISRRQEITVRELGGSMGPIWHKYYENTNAIIFMVDISNRLQVSSSCIQLFTVLKENKKSDIPVLLIFNKIHQGAGCIFNPDMSNSVWERKKRRSILGSHTPGLSCKPGKQFLAHLTESQGEWVVAVCPEKTLMFYWTNSHDSLNRDMPETMSQSEIESLYRIEDIVKTSNVDLTALTISAKTGQGLENVTQWIADHSQPKNQ